MAVKIDNDIIRKRVFTIIAFLIALAYVIYCICYWSPVLMYDGAVGALAFQLVLPHLICTVVGLVFTALALFLGKPWWDLAGGILFVVALVLFPAYWIFVVLPALFCFLGFARMRRQEQRAQNVQAQQLDHELDILAAESAKDDGVKVPADDKDNADEKDEKPEA